MRRLPETLVREGGEFSETQSFIFLFSMFRQRVGCLTKSFDLSFLNFSHTTMHRQIIVLFLILLYHIWCDDTHQKLGLGLWRLIILIYVKRNSVSVIDFGEFITCKKPFGSENDTID